MESKEKLAELRKEIDVINRDMISLFLRRMAVSEQVAEVKAAGNMAITDEGREEQVLESAGAGVDEGEKPDVIAFMRTLIALSKIRQTRTLMLRNPIEFPESSEMKRAGEARVGFQGVSGAWGEYAAEQLFPGYELERYEYFDDVFKAVRRGSVDYGVLPIENSQTGAIGEVYDLLKTHNCYIIKEVRIAVKQCLLGHEGATLRDVREVFSHPEGFNQSRRFLKNRSWDLTDCRNTAYAAQLAAEKGSVKYAAIGSRKAAALYGLKVLAEDVMDNPNNKTRFIAIGANPVYDGSSGITGITFSTAHKSGALCAVLQSFMLAGINLTRIESRPVSNDRYRFFADLDANISTKKTMEALEQASVHCDYFEILGCYSAVEERQ